MASKKKAMPAIQRVKILGILLLVPVGLSAALVFILGLFSQGNLPFETTFFGGGGICLGSLLLFWWLCVSFARTKGAGSSGNSTTGGSSGCGSCGEVVAVAVAVAAVVVVEVRLFPLLCLEQPWHGHENHTDCLLAICLCLPLMGDDASSGLESSGEVVS